MMRHRISSLLLAALGLLAGLMMLPLGLWDHGGPGAGLFPFLAALMLVCTGLATALQKQEQEIDEEPADRGRVLGYTLAITALLLTIQVAGMIVAIFLFVGGVLHWIEGKTLFRASMAGAGLALLSWLLFDYLLSVPLPTGMLEIG